MLATPHLIPLLVGCSALVVAAAHDLVARTIPNTACLVVAAAGVALRLGDGSLLPALAAAALTFLACAGLWRLGCFGGGDVKLLAAGALLLPPAALLPAFAAIAIGGALLALPYLAASGRIARPGPGRRTQPLAVRAWRAELFRLGRGGPLPYGVAIAAGLLASSAGIGG